MLASRSEARAQAPDWRYFLVAALACLLLAHTPRHPQPQWPPLHQLPLQHLLHIVLQPGVALLGLLQFLQELADQRGSAIGGFLNFFEVVPQGMFAAKFLEQAGAILVGEYLAAKGYIK